MEINITIWAKPNESDSCIVRTFLNNSQPESGIPPAGLKLLQSKVLNPLMKIIYQYKESDAYNKIPGKTEQSADSLEYFDGRFNSIYSALNQNLYISRKTYTRIFNIIREIQSFVHSFDGAEGLPERYFGINPNLKFHRVGFTKINGHYLYETVPPYMLTYIPKYGEAAAKEAYFAAKEREDKTLNLHRDADDFFIEDLAYTLRLVFLKALL